MNQNINNQQINNEVSEDEELEDLFPQPIEWMEDFKADWYRDNNYLPKKILNELWGNNRRLIGMIYKYQKKLFNKNIKEYAASNDKWISVESKLPEIGELVNVYTPDTSYRKVKSLMRLIRYEGATNFYWDNRTGTDTHIQEAVTHWQPLPPLPTK